MSSEVERLFSCRVLWGEKDVCEGLHNRGHGNDARKCDVIDLLVQRLNVAVGLANRGRRIAPC